MPKQGLNGTKHSLDRIRGNAVQTHGLILSAMGGGIGGGAYVVGAMKALKELGVLEYLAKVYASSAATPAIVYPLLGQDSNAEYVWSEEVTRKEVVDPLRFLSKEPILNIDYLVHEVLEHYPVDEPAFHSLQTDLFVSVTEVVEQTLEHTFLTNRDPSTPLQIIKAAIAIPLLYLLDGRTILLGGRRYMDGGVLKQLLLPENLDIVIATDHQGKKYYPGYGERALLCWYRMQGRVDSTIAEAIKKRHAVAVEDFAELYARKQKQRGLIIIRPAHRLPAHIISTKPKDVLQTIQQGYKDTMKKYPAIERRLAERLIYG